MCLAQSETLLTIPEVREEQLICKEETSWYFFLAWTWNFGGLACLLVSSEVHVERNSLVMNDNLLLGVKLSLINYKDQYPQSIEPVLLPSSEPVDYLVQLLLHRVSGVYTRSSITVHYVPSTCFNLNRESRQKGSKPTACAKSTSWLHELHGDRNLSA